MDEGYTSCNFLFPTVIGASNPVQPPSIGITVRVRGQAVPIYKQMREMIFPRVRPAVTDMRSAQEIGQPSIEPGEWVEVRSVEEISRTLDGSRKQEGLYFMPEMEKYCGQKFRVFKRVTTIKLESTGEVRHLRNPAVFLEGVYCSGERHQGCDRACFHYWREVVAHTNSLSGDPAEAFSVSHSHVTATGRRHGVTAHGRQQVPAEMPRGFGGDPDFLFPSRIFPAWTEPFTTS